MFLFWDFVFLGVAQIGILMDNITISIKKCIRSLKQIQGLAEGKEVETGIVICIKSLFLLSFFLVFLSFFMLGARRQVCVKYTSSRTSDQIRSIVRLRIRFCFS